MDLTLKALMPVAPAGMRFHVYAYEPYGQKTQWVKIELQERRGETLFGKPRWVKISDDCVIPSEDTDRLYGSIEQQIAKDARALVTKYELGKGLSRFDGYYG